MAEPDPVMDYLLRDDPPEVREDPDFREHMRGTMAYQAAALSFEAHRLVENGIASLPRWMQPGVRGWQRFYWKWIDPIGRKITR